MPTSFEFHTKITTTARRGSQARWDLIHGEFFPFYLILITIFCPCAVARFRCRYCKRSNSFCDDENLIVKNKHLFTTFIVFYCAPSRGIENRWKKFVRLKKFRSVCGRGAQNVLIGWRKRKIFCPDGTTVREYDFPVRFQGAMI